MEATTTEGKNLDRCPQAPRGNLEENGCRIWPVWPQLEPVGSTGALAASFRAGFIIPILHLGKARHGEQSKHQNETSSFSSTSLLASFQNLQGDF